VEREERGDSVRVCERELRRGGKVMWRRSESFLREGSVDAGSRLSSSLGDIQWKPQVRSRWIEELVVRVQRISHFLGSCNSFL